MSHNGTDQLEGRQRTWSLDRKTLKRPSSAHCPDICAGCSRVIQEDTVILAMDCAWHTACFKCCVCSVPLPNKYFEQDGKAYCEEDLYKKFAQICHKCHKIISGPVMSAGDQHLFHPECFLCTECGNPIAANDLFTLLASQALLCRDCTGGKPREGHRAVQKIRIQVPKGKHLKLRLDGPCPDEIIAKSPKMPKKSALRIDKLPHRLLPAEYGNLQQGDEIVEINGVSIKWQNQEDINRLLLLNKEYIMLTIDRKGAPSHSILDTPLAPPPVTRSISTSHNHMAASNLTTPKTSRSISVPGGQLNFGPKGPRPLSPLNNAGARAVKGDSVLVTGDNGMLSWVSKESLGPKKEGENCDDDEEEEEKELERIEQAMYVGMTNETKASVDLPDLPDKPALQRLINRTTEMRQRSLRVNTPQVEYIRCFKHHDLEIGEVLGNGFFGQVYKVTHRGTGQEMVMKAMVRCTEEAKKGFLKEVSVLKALDHPHLLRFIGVLYSDGSDSSGGGGILNIITEYIPGGTLRAKIKNLNDPFPWRQRIGIAKDIAAGMDYLHGQHVIHRDLTSTNCLLREDGSAVVADFGLARSFQPIEQIRQWSYIKTPSPDKVMKRRRTPPNGLGGLAANGTKDIPSNSPSSFRVPSRGLRRRMTVVGTPYWMAPEMLNGQDYDDKVDVFSFGIVTCEMIGRVSADPEYLPRLPNFGLDGNSFKPMAEGCPQPFLDLALLCCRLDAEKRPSFGVAVEGLACLLGLGDGDLFSTAVNFYQLPGVSARVGADSRSGGDAPTKYPSLFGKDPSPVCH
nr:LIM domain kinase [Halisarca dujardinii]